MRDILIDENEAKKILQFIAKKASSNGSFSAYHDSDGWHIDIVITYVMRAMLSSPYLGEALYDRSFNIYASMPKSPFKSISLLSKMIELSESGHDICFSDKVLLRNGTTLEQILVAMELEKAIE